MLVLENQNLNLAELRLWTPVKPLPFPCGLRRIVLGFAGVSGLDDKVTAIPVERRAIKHVVALIFVGF